MVRRGGGLLVVILIIQSLFFDAKGQTAYIPPEKPKLVVGIVVEQLRYDHLEQYRNRLAENGIRLLLNEGTYYQNASYEYMLTQSAPGHATISTGAEPSVHGITSDNWYASLRNELIYSTADNSVGPVGGSYESGQRSPINLLASTFSDELKMATNGVAKVYAVGMKDNSAILSAGHSADAAYWYDNSTGTWMTSNYYRDSLPDWINDFNASGYSDTFLDGSWTLLRPIEDYTDCVPDSNAFEAGFDGVNYFPYDLKKMSTKRRLLTKEKDYSLLDEVPFGNSLTNQFAMKLIEKEELGLDDVTDFLTICFSATDNIGHRFGPSSFEVADAVYRLDKDIAELLAFLNDKIGKRNILVYFTSAHGVSEIPDIRESYRIPSGYFIQNQAIQLLRSYLNVLYGEGNWVKGYSERQIFLNREFIEDAKIDLDEIRQRVARFMVQFAGVASAYPYSAFETNDFVDGNLSRISNSFSPKRTGDVIIILNPGWVEKEDDHVTEHNSPYEYDTHVPLIWYGWSANRATVTRKVNLTDISATLSSLLKVPYPNACTGEPLFELFR
jgi:predicted AlkP superfamily pyrophosphatase or phosphodiesterase